MKFRKLVELFREHAEAIRADKSSKSNSYRANSYDAAASKMENAGLDNTVTKDKLSMIGLTEYMKKTAIEVSKNGAFSSASTTVSTTDSKEPTKSVDKEKLIAQLTNYMGIGVVKAEELIANGLKSFDQIHTKKYKDLLTNMTKLFLDKKPSREIPHDDIKKLEQTLTSLDIKSANEIMIVGSYRRQKPTSRDIDVMIVSDNKDVLIDYKNSLEKKIPVYTYSVGPDKLSLLIDARDILHKSDAVYKIDAFRSTTRSKYAMLLYSTGSKENNIAMRSKAKKLGMLLNQNGLYQKNDDGSTTLVYDLDSERAYFDKLGMTYKEPKDR
jgi:DNA polymerase/3'-5' exonuclease PolX